jgi:hypothetical protein
MGAGTRAWRSWTVGWAVFALLLEAAVPMLASAAAHLQGVPVAQVCDVYGVRTALPDHPHHEPAAHHESSHAGHDPPAPSEQGPHGAAGDAGTHCALVALGALAAGADPSPSPTVRGEAVRSPAAPPRVPGHDATARWIARLKHGPPSPA